MTYPVVIQGTPVTMTLAIAKPTWDAAVRHVNKACPLFGSAGQNLSRLLGEMRRSLVTNPPPAVLEAETNRALWEHSVRQDGFVITPVVSDVNRSEGGLQVVVLLDIAVLPEYTDAEMVQENWEIMEL